MVMRRWDSCLPVQRLRRSERPSAAIVTSQGMPRAGQLFNNGAARSGASSRALEAHAGTVLGAYGVGER
jgi:hypothetical protein